MAALPGGRGVISPAKVRLCGGIPGRVADGPAMAARFRGVFMGRVTVGPAMAVLARVVPQDALRVPESPPYRTGACNNIPNANRCF